MPGDSRFRRSKGMSCRFLLPISENFPDTVRAETVFPGEIVHRAAVPIVVRDGAVALIVLGAGTGLAAPRRALFRRFRDVNRFALDVFPYLYKKLLRQNFFRISVAYRCTAFRNITASPNAGKAHGDSALSKTRFPTVGTPTFRLRIRQSTATSIEIVILHYLLFFKDSAPVAVLSL